MRQTADLGQLFSRTPRTHPIRNPSIYSYKGEVSRPSPTKQTMLILARTREKKIYTYKTFNIHTYNIQMSNLLLLMIHTYIHTHTYIN